MFVSEFGWRVNWNKRGQDAQREKLHVLLLLFFQELNKETQAQSKCFHSRSRRTEHNWQLFNDNVDWNYRIITSKDTDSGRESVCCIEGSKHHFIFSHWFSFEQTQRKTTTSAVYSSTFTMIGGQNIVFSSKYSFVNFERCHAQPFGCYLSCHLGLSPSPLHNSWLCVWQCQNRGCSVSLSSNWT